MFTHSSLSQNDWDPLEMSPSAKGLWRAGSSGSGHQNRVPKRGGGALKRDSKTGPQKVSRDSKNYPKTGGEALKNGIPTEPQALSALLPAELCDRALRTQRDPRGGPGAPEGPQCCRSILVSFQLCRGELEPGLSPAKGIQPFRHSGPLAKETPCRRLNFIPHLNYFSDQEESLLGNLPEQDPGHRRYSRAQEWSCRDLQVGLQLLGHR